MIKIFLKNNSLVHFIQSLIVNSVIRHVDSDRVDAHTDKLLLLPNISLKPRKNSSVHERAENSLLNKIYINCFVILF